MRAARRGQYGPPRVIRIEDVPVPVPADNEILVRVHAATVSRTDCAVLSAQPFVMRFLLGLLTPSRKTLGTDFAGIVEAVGPRVTRFGVGDRVWGINDLGIGSHAEFLVVSERDSVSSMPSDVEFPRAVACLEGGWYAYSALERSALAKGGRVLVNGATGAIGSALVQLAVQRAATVTAVGNAKNLDLLRSLGATRVIDYERTDFTRDTQTCDYVFDAVGKSTFGACRRLLAPRGVYLSSEGGPGWQNLPLALITPVLGGRRVVFPFPVNRTRFVELAGSLVADRHLRPVIDRTVSLDEIVEAYDYVASGQKTGAVVVRIAGGSGRP